MEDELSGKIVTTFVIVTEQVMVIKKKKQKVQKSVP